MLPPPWHRGSRSSPSLALSPQEGAGGSEGPSHSLSRGEAAPPPPIFLRAQRSTVTLPSQRAEAEWGSSGS